MESSVLILGTGGTIASVSNDDGASPERRGEELVSTVPEIGDYADVEVEQITQLPSSDMDFASVAELARRSKRAPNQGFDSVVIMHGTDTMEESAYYLDLVLEDVPVVFTGAMRRADAVSADGPGNLLGSIRVATDERIRENGGVYVALNDELHAARDVTKTHTAKLNTFASPGVGKVATLYPEDIAFHRRSGSPSSTIPATEPTSDVEIVTSGIGATGRQIDRAVADGIDGVVIRGTGAGNTTRAILDSIDAHAESIPIVLTSRCLAGKLSDSYETGRMLREKGVITGGDLPAHKARIKLLLALEHATDTREVQAIFDNS